ncbi:MAG: hypothetical protein JO222_04130 [Frankiales bacterium]|nr:hypothetical protein [Frankiales bacterium]
MELSRIKGVAAAAAFVVTASLAVAPGWTANADTTKPTAKTTPPASAWRPIFADVEVRNRQQHLVVGRLGRVGARHIIFNFAQGPSSGGVGTIAVSHSGKRVAFNYADRGDWVIAVIDADGRGYRVLSHAFTEQLVWSADDRRIFFDRNYHGVERIWRVPADGSARPKRIANSERAVPTAAASNGRWLALWSSRGGPAFGRCAIIRVNGAGRRNVGPDNCESPLWRPHASTLATSRFIRSNSHSLLTQQIWVLYLRSGRYRAIPHVQSAGRDGIATPLAWDRGGAFLYYEHCGNHSCRYYRIRPDGTGKRDLTAQFPPTKWLVTLQPG